MSDIAGVVVKSSPFTVKESMERLTEFLLKRGFIIYTRIDQQDELKKVGLSILPLEYILFGNPSNGGLLMIENPLVALDLPLKIVAYMDNENKVWLVYNDNSYIKERYHLQQTSTREPNLDDLVAGAFSNP